MKRRLIFGFVGAVLAVNLLIGARVYSEASEAPQKDSVYPNMKLFSEVMEKVRRDYVDGTNPTYQDLVYGALKGMVNELDPHSEFLDPDKIQRPPERYGRTFRRARDRDRDEGQFCHGGFPLMEDTPGFKAGILFGDRIIKINGKSTEKMTLQDAVKMLRGDPDTEVSVTMLRPSSGQVKDYPVLTRAIINVDMVKDINGKKEFPLGENKIGYIRLVQFGEKTSDDLEVALNKLKDQGMQALVLDLRWNPGGLLDQAVEVCEKFLPRGQLIVSTEGRNSAQNSKHRASGHGDELHGMPIVVLVNLGSASASEIVSGCLQDLHRAIILGEKTFGKGSVQSIIPLDDGSALRLTTAKYYTPSHKVIHEVGITPNIVVPTTDEEDKDIRLQLTPGGVESLSQTERDQLKAARDPQLQRANDLLKGIMLYTDRSSGHPSDRMAAQVAHDGEAVK